MPKLSDSQRSILKAASKQPKTDVREFMAHIKSPPIREKVVHSMLGNGLVVEDFNAEGVVYVISEAGFAAIGKKPSAHDAAAEEKEAAAPKAKTKAPAKKREPKPKREGASKKQTMIDMLSRKEGVTIQQLMDTIGWQKHSVHGAMANLKTKDGLTIASTKADGEERIYKIA